MFKMDVQNSGNDQDCQAFEIIPNFYWIPRTRFETDRLYDFKLLNQTINKSITDKNEQLPKVVKFAFKCASSKVILRKNENMITANLCISIYPSVLPARQRRTDRASRPAP